MKTIIRGRDSGKTHELLEAAAKAEGIVLTMNKTALQVKANSYGFYNLTIIDYDDLKTGNYHYGQPIFIHNVDKLLDKVLSSDYGLELKGFSATINEEVN